MVPVSLLIFDLDGTLVDTLGDLAGSVNYALGLLNRKPISEEAVREFVGDGTRVLLTRALGANSGDVDEALRFFEEHYRRNLVVRSALYPGVRETLEHFRAVPMAVISNKTNEFIQPLLERLGIARRFRLSIGAGQGIPLKPAPDSVLRIMAELRGTPARTAVVGDGTTDVLAGKAAGAMTCAVTYGFRSGEELRRAGPDFVLDRFAGLKQIFTPAPDRSRDGGRRR